MLLTPCRIAATSPVAAGPCSVGIMCRGNKEWQFPVIASAWEDHAGSKGFPAAESPPLPQLAADTADLIWTTTASLLMQGFQRWGGGFGTELWGFLPKSSFLPLPAKGWVTRKDMSCWECSFALPEMASHESTLWKCFPLLKESFLYTVPSSPLLKEIWCSLSL